MKRWSSPVNPTRILLIFFVLTGCSGNQRAGEPKTGAIFLADSVYVQRGNQIVARTFDTLRNSLLYAIRSQGLEEAITFCNEKAYSLTATYADSVVVRRTSLRFRNPDNKPDSLERLILSEMDTMKAAYLPVTKVFRHDATGEIHFFKPILLQSMCLNCHGTPGQHIQDATLFKIQQLYPNDQAVNYKEGDLRGLWHIIFNANKK